MLVTHHSTNVTVSIEADTADIQKLLDKEETRYLKLEVKYEKINSKLSDSFYDNAPKELVQKAILELHECMREIIKCGDLIAYYMEGLINSHINDILEERYGTRRFTTELLDGKLVILIPTSEGMK